MAAQDSIKEDLLATNEGIAEVKNVLATVAAGVNGIEQQVVELKAIVGNFPQLDELSRLAAESKAAIASLKEDAAKLQTDIEDGEDDVIPPDEPASE